LAAVRVDGQLTVEGDAPPAVEPVLRLAEAAEPEALDPGDGVEGEAVVDERDVDIARPQVGARPQVRGLADDLRLVGDGALVPGDALVDLRADRIDPDRRLG
jgi:hypothetical protein